jgi:hypothetical protein
MAGKHHSPKLQSAWNKYGRDAFRWRLVERVPDGDSIKAREQHWIDAAGDARLNCSPAADSPRGVRRTPEQCEANSLAKRMYYATPEGRAHLERMHAKNRGRKQPPEERSMRSRLLTGNKSLGREWTQEQRAAHSKALTGRKMPAFSPEWKANISAGIRRAKERKALEVGQQD